MSRRVVIIGLDGATFELIKPWSEAGYLPHFRNLIQNGAHGVLTSTVPWTTLPAWTSFATGKNPGKHGCYDFRLPTDSLGHNRFVTSDDIPGKTFYELLVDTGKKVTLINLPVSYPPRIDQTVITSLMTRGSNCVFPPELAETVPELRDYRIVAKTRNLEEIRAVEKHRFVCARQLFERDWDLFFLLFSGSDHISHEMYTEMLREEMPERGGKVFKDLDRYLGWFMDHLPPKTDLFVMSDHGFRSIPGIFYINSWLEQEGYLTLGGDVRPEGEDLLSKMENEVNQRDQLKLGWMTQILFNHPFLYRIGKTIYQKVKSFLPFAVHLDSQGVRLAETLAYAATNECKGVYINDRRRFVDGVVDDENVNPLREEIIEKLERLTDPAGKEKILAKVWRKEDLYWGEHLHYAPDIILEPNYFVSFLLRSTDPFESTTVNYHSRAGVLIAWGPDVDSGTALDNVEIVDLAPTILHMMDSPIPEDMDGKVLRQAFRADSAVARREVRFQEGTGSQPRDQGNKQAEDIDIVERRLKDLGYLA